MDIPRTMLHALHDQAGRRGDAPALWTKRGGAYQPTSWREYARRVRHFALGLHRLGFGPGQALTIIGFNREEWLVASLAAMALGGVPVGIYVTSSPEQIRYVAGHCESPIMLVENEGTLATVQALRRELPKLRQVVVMDPPAALQREQGVLSYAEVLESGAGQDEGLYFERVNGLEPASLATLIYTSGTTGNPKGVMLSHRNLTWTAVQLSKLAELGEDEVVLSYLPLSHIAEQICSIHGPLVCGVQVHFAEALEKLPENLKEVRPTAFFAVPRVWEKFKARAEEGMRALPPHHRRIVEWARSAAARRHGLSLEHRRVPPWLELQYRLAQKLVFEKLKARIGFGRTHIFATSAAPIAKEVLEFFASVDMVVREVYGQSEVTGPTSVNTAEATRLGSLGRPMPGVEVRIAEDGEILVRGENVCMGYYKEEAATAELLEGGWLHSGDVGELDAQGYLRITGRKKEIIVTSGGKKTPPATLEGLLKSIDPIGNALVVGDRRHFLVAILALDPEKLRSFSKASGFPSEPAQLVEHGPFLEHLKARIDADVNAKVAKFETIKRFKVLPNDFTIEGGELTSTLKVRRKVCEEKYGRMIEEMYSSAVEGRGSSVQGDPSSERSA
ncbi:MAG: long-chain fatty acid--CoA ligase [Myxococcales bacterium]|nr:long-chain fatty acid--CoA ligase [Myxococcales bacterium]